ncbi:MAG: hypothetical protein IPO21_04120 [Bacteroidales bacterium]|nr:hypothetical protein [Bacteroidales bacterium]
MRRFDGNLRSIGNSYLLPPMLVVVGFLIFTVGFTPREKITFTHSGIIEKIRFHDILVIDIWHCDTSFLIHENEAVRIKTVIQELNIGDTIELIATNDRNIICQISKSGKIIIPYEEEYFPIYAGSIIFLVGIALLPLARSARIKSRQNHEKLIVIESVENSTYPSECKKDIEGIKKEYQENKQNIYTSFKIKKIGMKRLEAELQRVEIAYVDKLVLFFKQYNEKQDFIINENESKTIKVGNITIVDENGQPIIYED